MRRAVVLAIVFGCSAQSSPPEGGAPPVAQRVPPKPVEHNIARADYVGPKLCADCHTSEYGRWSQSLHRVMNAKTDEPGAVIGDFANATLHYAGGDARFTREGTRYVMTLARGAATTTYDVTRTIGRRALQEYVGTERGGDGTEVRLPFGWWPKRAGWYPQAYFDPWLGREPTGEAFAPVREPWAERCPWCHSTYAFEQRIARAAGPEHLGHGLEQQFVGTAPAEPDRLDGAGLPRPGSAAGWQRGVLDVAAQVTTGISCESCHLGAAGHLRGAAMQFVPRGAARHADADLPPPSASFDVERKDPRVVNGVCAQCHSGPSPRLADGTALRNSSEAIDLDASPCLTISCLDCHDPHRGESGLDPKLVAERANAACVRCHGALADPTAAHAHRGPGHDTTQCIDCHMPRVVLGIDHVVRTHRISSPTDPKLLAAAAPNACNVCHVDRPIGWTLDALRADWQVAIQPTTAAYGATDRDVGDVWLASGIADVRLLAMDAYVRAGRGHEITAALRRGLDDASPFVRVWTLFAVEQMLGHSVADSDYDPRAAPDVRRGQLARLKL